MIEKFENHPNKESFLQDYKQTKEINKYFTKHPQNSSALIAIYTAKSALSTVLVEDA